MQCEPEPQKYHLRFFFDPGSGVCFWTANDRARARFANYPVAAGALPLPRATIQRIEELVARYDRSLNWDYPPDPGPWRQAEWDDFNAAVRDVLATVRRQLGDEFEIISEYRDGNEDADLDEYLRTGRRPARAVHVAGLSVPEAARGVTGDRTERALPRPGCRDAVCLGIHRMMPASRISDAAGVRRR